MDSKTRSKLRREKLKELGYYVYVYLDPRKEGSFIYEDILFENEPFYVGKGYGLRINEHLYKCSLKRKNHKNNKIKKILAEGLNPIKIKIFEGLTEKEALEKEIEIIKLIGIKNLCNKTLGGDGTSGFKQKKSTKLKISKKNKGRKHSEETKKKISEKLKDRIITEEWRENISKGSRGIKKTFTDEHKKNIGKSGLGRAPWNKGCKDCKPAWNKGIKMSEESKLKMSESKKNKKTGPKTEDIKKKISESLKKYHELKLGITLNKENVTLQ